MLTDVLAAFSAATGVHALNLAGILLLVCTGLGGVLTLAWVLHAGQEALRHGGLRAPRTVLFSVAAFLFLLIILGALYD